MYVGGLFLAWWLFASRAYWREKVSAVAAVLIAAGLAMLFAHDREAMGFGLFLYGVPTLLAAWTLWLVLSRGVPRGIRVAGLLLAIFASVDFYALLRIDGIDGAFTPGFNWRWTKKPEEEFLASRSASKATPAAQPAAEVGPPLVYAPGDWPAFRGPNRDSRIVGVRIDSDWKTSPPKLLWRQRVGPGWSSFAVVGDYAFTQEQRGKNEAVVCYNPATGSERWAFEYERRFEEIVAGAGPRATPTFDKGRVYALGARGDLLCLDAKTGAKIWERNIATDSGAKTPQWGFASSPLAAAGLVSLFAGGPKGKSVLAYRTTDGSLAWSAGDATSGYSSTHLANFCGVEQLLVSANDGLTSFDPVRGTVLWRHEFPVDRAIRVVQPAPLSSESVLLGTGQDVGTRIVHLSRAEAKWTSEPGWTSKDFKPYFNDFVVHKGYGYGIDGVLLVCFDLKGGKRLWAKRSYGDGQLLLLVEQDLLLILSEQGEVALVQANPAKWVEVAKFQAIEGKTWNHPVVANGRLLVRNAAEAACFQLSDLGSQPRN
jgi:outer membrane protein assembly factor BamB